MVYFIMLGYCTVRCDAVLYCILQRHERPKACYATLRCATLYHTHTIPYRTVPYHTILYYTALCNAILCCIVSYTLPGSHAKCGMPHEGLRKASGLREASRRHQEASGRLHRPHLQMLKTHSYIRRRPRMHFWKWPSSMVLLSQTALKASRRGPHPCQGRGHRSRCRHPWSWTPRHTPPCGGLPRWSSHT